MKSKSKNKVKRTKRVRSHKRVQRTSKRTRRSFLKNKRKTQKRKRILRGGFDQATIARVGGGDEQVRAGFPRSAEGPGIVYQGNKNETTEKICSGAVRTIGRMDAEFDDSTVAHALGGSIMMALKLEYDALQFIKRREPSGLPELSEDLYVEYMKEIYPADYSNATDGVAVEGGEKDEAHRYSFETAYLRGMSTLNHANYTKYNTALKSGPAIELEEVVTDLLNYCGSKLNLVTLDTLCSRLFAEYYDKGFAPKMKTFLGQIREIPNSVKFIYKTLERFKSELSARAVKKGKKILVTNISFLEGQLCEALLHTFEAEGVDENLEDIRIRKADDDHRRQVEEDALRRQEEDALRRQEEEDAIRHQEEDALRHQEEDVLRRQEGVTRQVEEGTYTQPIDIAKPAEGTQLGSSWAVTPSSDPRKLITGSGS